ISFWTFTKAGNVPSELPTATSATRNLFQRVPITLARAGWMVLPQGRSAMGPLVLGTRLPSPGEADEFPGLSQWRESFTRPTENLGSAAALRCLGLGPSVPHAHAWPNKSEPR